MKYDFKGISRIRIAAWAVVLLAVLTAAIAIRIAAMNQSVLRNTSTSSSTSNSTGPSNPSNYNFRSNNSYKSETPLIAPSPRTALSRETQTRLTPLDPAPQTNYGYKNYEAEALRTQIEQAEQSLDRLKSEIDSITDEMAPYKEQIDKYAAVIKRTERDQEMGLSVDQGEYERALRYHNYNVDLYNSKLAERREKVSEYNQLLTDTKAKINRYNAMIKASP
jgi:peptidoglycan hydrolase CwlO-like protein